LTSRKVQAAETPDAVRSWLSNRPDWLEVTSVSSPPELDLDYLGEGERDAILLAKELGADGLLIDDRDGRREAQRRELRVIGTLGVLAAAAEKRLLNLPQAVDRLKATTFRASPRLYEALLKRFAPD